MIKTLIVGEMQTNCYIICLENNDCFLIDPGSNGQKISNYIEENELSLKAIFLTHGHFDHIGAVDYLFNKYECKIYANTYTIEVCKNPDYNLSSLIGNPFVIHAPIEELNDVLVTDGLTIQNILLEGHCLGSSMFYFKDLNSLFSGDVLFKGSIGRDDFPTSSHLQTKQSLEKIKQFDFDAVLYPGHGESSTLSIEKVNNYYLK